MDAVKFQKEMARMCRYANHRCGECELCGRGCTAVEVNEGIAEKRVEIVEKWSKEHPLTTNRIKVLEMIPDDVRKMTITREYPSTKDYVKMYIEKSWWDAEYKE